MWWLSLNVTFPSTSSSSSALIHKWGGGDFKPSLPSADESDASMAQATTFIGLATALIDLSIINILERVMEEGGEKMEWGNNREGGEWDLQTFICVCMTVCVLFSSLKQHHCLSVPESIIVSPVAVIEMWPYEWVTHPPSLIKIVI